MCRVIALVGLSISLAIYLCGCGASPTSGTESESLSSDPPATNPVPTAEPTASPTPSPTPTATPTPATTAAATPTPSPTPTPTPAPEVTASDRLSVTDEVRAACLPLTDTEILSILLTAESDRVLGITWTEILSESLVACSSIECFTCGAAVVHQVYDGQDSQTLPPIPAPALVETFIVAQDGQFLGYVNDNAFDSDSIANEFGTYGNEFGSLSIWNEFGTYGGDYGAFSPWNAYTTTPPLIIEGSAFVGYLTTNTMLTPSVHPADLAVLVGRVDVLD